MKKESTSKKAIGYRNNNNGTLEGFDGAELMEDANDLLTLDVDVLVPAAIEDVIHQGNVEDVKSETNC